MPHRYRWCPPLRSRGLSWLLVPGITALMAACAHQSPEMARQVELMGERLLILQNDRDRLEERVDALEANALATSSTRHTVRDAPTRPALKVVKLVPDSQDDEQRLSAASERSEPRSRAGRKPAAQAVQEVAGADASTQASATATPDTTSLAAKVEPRVVLYGEGPASGIRTVPAGEEQ